MDLILHLEKLLDEGKDENIQIVKKILEEACNLGSIERFEEKNPEYMTPKLYALIKSFSRRIGNPAYDFSIDSIFGILMKLEDFYFDPSESLEKLLAKIQLLSFCPNNMSDEAHATTAVTKLGLRHLCVPYLAQCSFIPKNQTLQNGFFISVAQNEWKKHPYIFFLLSVQKQMCHLSVTTIKKPFCNV